MPGSKIAIARWPRVSRPTPPSRSNPTNSSAPSHLSAAGRLANFSSHYYTARMSLYTIETYGELEPHLSQEWIQTNGLGSFASSSVVGCNTRRYHGVLCAAVMPPVGRLMALSRIAESLRIDRSETQHDLSVNIFRDNLFPRGERYLRRFEV